MKIRIISLPYNLALANTGQLRDPYIDISRAHFQGCLCDKRSLQKLGQKHQPDYSILGRHVAPTLIHQRPYCQYNFIYKRDSFFSPKDKLSYFHTGLESMCVISQAFSSSSSLRTLTTY